MTGTVTVRAAIDDGGATSVRELGARAGVHPVYLARQFRRWYRHSITECRTCQRVRERMHWLGLLRSFEFVHQCSRGANDSLPV